MKSLVLKKAQTLYSREEAKKLKEQFWTNFGQYLSLTPNEDGDKINWVNYKTGVKHLYFRMETEGKTARIFIEISHPDAGMRELMYEQLLTYRQMLHGALDEEWEWDAYYEDSEGKQTARVSKSLTEKTSVFDPNDWPTLISFFKPRLLSLDSFWSSAKYGFEIFK